MSTDVPTVQAAAAAASSTLLARRRWATALTLGGTVAGVAYRRGALNRDGAAAATLVGGTTYLAGGARWSALLLGFFASSSALSRLEHSTEAGRAIAAMANRGARRDAVQVLANGGLATIAAASYCWAPTAAASAGFAGALAAANADTWATELGGLHPQPPRDIVSGKEVPAGTSGGVTPMGLAGATAGSALIALLAGCCQRSTARRQRAVIVLLSGMTGALIDSVLGATVQAKYTCPQCNTPTERRIHHCGTRTTHVRGMRWCTNDTVNALCTACGALMAAALAIIARDAERP